jgi:hypothetical protein
MNRLLDIVAQVISVVFYPLFVPTYGVALYCYATHTLVNPLPPIWMGIAIIGTLLFTCILPLSAIAVMMRRGDISDFQIDNSKERTMPYIYSAFGFGCWSYLMIHILEAPEYIGFICVGATVAIALVAIINHWWKISAHLTGFGGLFGGVMVFCIGINAIPTWGTLGLWIGISLSIVYARLRLHAHTPEQVAAGWLVGVSCTTIPYCIHALV